MSPIWISCRGFVLTFRSCCVGPDRKATDLVGRSERIRTPGPRVPRGRIESPPWSDKRHSDGPTTRRHSHDEDYGRRGINLAPMGRDTAIYTSTEPRDAVNQRHGHDVKD